MSTTFKLSGPSFDLTKWHNSLKQLLRGETAWKPFPCMSRLISPDGRPADMSDPPVVRSYFVLLGQGSTQGVEVTQESGTVTLGLRMSSSLADWSAARWLIDAGMRAGANVSGDAVPDGGSLTESDLLPETFTATATKTIGQMIGTGKAIALQDGSGLTFPVAHFDLSLSKEETFNLSPSEMLDVLARRCEAFASAHIATTMKAQYESGRVIRYVAHCGVPTLFAHDIDGLMFGEPGGTTLSDDLVELDHVLKLLGAHVVKTGRFYFLPAIDWSKQPGLLEALLGKPSTEISQHIANQHLDKATMALLIAFVLIAAADGSADDKEVAKFLDLLGKAGSASNDNSLFAQTARTLQGELRERMAVLKQPGYDITAALIDGLRSSDQLLSPKERHEFRTRLYSIVEEVAKASGGGFLGFGSKISKGEQRSLDQLKAILFPSA